jgi:hypothetical protein
MANSKEFIERRKHKRFKIKNGAVAAMITTAPVTSEQTKVMSMSKDALATTKNKYIRMGQIINISKGGLAFRYTDGGGKSIESSELDILFTQDGFYLDRLPFKTVWTSNAVGIPSVSLLQTSQRGVQFMEMTSHQISQLDYFLHNYTIRQQESP